MTTEDEEQLLRILQGWDDHWRSVHEWFERWNREVLPINDEVIPIPRERCLRLIQELKSLRHDIAEVKDVLRESLAERLH
jgi:hypothetical protein